MTPITRFAPSPTGLLHLGGARTALFNFVYAKSNKGKFKLRIEDTDKSRNSSESVKSIINGLNWLGLNNDDEIIYQNHQINEHIKIANKMLSDGFAYKCFHTEKELTLKKKDNKKFRSEWRDKSKTPSDRKFCVRLKSPLLGETILNDKIQQKVTINNKELDDYIILRTDGTPTFLLSSAIDDFLMSITHIIRGDDHLTNSFRQFPIFNYLDYKPSFCHIPLIHNENNEKLSKRHNPLSIDDYKNKGYLPETIINYMLRLGWSYGDKEIISVSEALENFKLEKIGKSSSMLDKKKILFLNNFYLKNKKNDEILVYLNQSNFFNKKVFEDYDDFFIKNLISIFKERSRTLIDLIESMKLSVKDEFIFEKSEKIILHKTINFKNEIINELTRLDNWNDYIIESTINDLIHKLNIKFKDVGQPLRLSLLGCLNGPTISKFMEIIGKEKTIQKIKINWK